MGHEARVLPFRLPASAGVPRVNLRPTPRVVERPQQNARCVPLVLAGTISEAADIITDTLMRAAEREAGIEPEEA